MSYFFLCNVSNEKREINSNIQNLHIIMDKIGTRVFLSVVSTKKNCFDPFSHLVFFFFIVYSNIWQFKIMYIKIKEKKHKYIIHRIIICFVLFCFGVFYHFFFFLCETWYFWLKTLINFCSLPFVHGKQKAGKLLLKY